MFYYGLVHAVVLYFSFAYLGVFLGPIAVIVFVHVLDYVLGQYGYQRLTFGDHCMSLELQDKNHNIGGYFETDKITHKEFSDLFLERVIKSIQKFRTVQVKSFGTYLWKQVSTEMAMAQIMKIGTDISTEEEVLEYFEKLSNQQLDKSRPLWEFRIIEDYTENTSMIVYRMHHGFIDGVGFVSLMSALNDKQFTTTMDKKFGPKSMLQKITGAVSTPIVLGKVLPIVDAMQSDDKATKIRECEGKETGAGLYLTCKTVPFDRVRKAYKQHKGMTFNDWMMGILSKSHYEWYKHYGVTDAKDLFMIIPVNLRNLPTCYDDCQIDCGIVGSKFILPIRNTVAEGMTAIKPTLQKLLTPEILEASKNLCWLVPYLPEVLGRVLFSKCTEKADVSFSNIPFNKQHWSLNGKQVKSMTFFNNLQVGLNVNNIAITYGGQVQVTVIAKKELKMDPILYKDLIYKNMVEELQKVPKDE